MFEITKAEDGSIKLKGRLDAAQENRATEVLESATASTLVDFGELSYISSAGLGVLLRAQKRLMAEGATLRIVNISPHIREIFEMAGFDQLFRIEDSA